MYSMTGFGQASGESSTRRLSVVLRGVNHRYLDVMLRLPDICRGSEAALQRLLGARLARGRVELTVEVESLAPSAPQLELHTELARALVGAVERLRSEGIVSGELAPGELLQVPGLVDLRVTEQAWDEADEALLLEVVTTALEEMLGARRAEGSRLAEVIAAKVGQLRALLAELEALRPQAQSAVAESLRGRLAELTIDAELDTGRLEQEIAVLIDRSNVSEELERLAAHLDHLDEIVAEAGAIGKRLDFVVQEVFRELNTLSAKCRSADMTRRAVDAKVLCEELREQLRNVE